MKIKVLKILVLFVLAVSSCQPPVVFDRPQPLGVVPLSEIPNDYHGIYWCGQDSISLFIDNLTISRRKEYETTITRSEIEASPDLALQNGQLYAKTMKRLFPTEIKGDSVTALVTYLDTLFTFMPEQVLKPFKGHLILNKKLEENFWEVLILSSNNNGALSIYSVDLPENLAKLDSITSIKTLNTDREQILVSPTKAEFGQILKRGLLFDASCRVYKPVEILGREPNK